MQEAVEIIPSSELAGRRLATIEHPLRFPAGWRADPIQNRYAEVIERETLRWLAAQGIGLTAEERERLRKFDCGKDGGYSLPCANYATALLVTRFISLWLFWDDMQVERDAAFSIDDVVRGLAEGSAPACNRYVAAWCDLGAQLRATQSPAWMRRLCLSMQHWLENARIETLLARELRTGGRQPDFDRLLMCRTVSIGMFPTFYLLELSEGLELDAAVHEHASVLALKTLASRLVGIGNDIQGLAKDIHHNWLNLVRSAQDDLSIERALAEVAALHNRSVLAFDAIADDLPSFGLDTDALLRGWVQSVRHNVYGFVLWEASAERYQQHKIAIAGRLLTAPIVELSGELDSGADERTRPRTASLEHALDPR